jgi:hypothetical protein
VRAIGIIAGVLSGLLAMPAMAAVDLEKPLPAGVVVRGIDCGAAASAVTGGGAAGCAGVGTNVDLMIVDPGNPQRRASTSSFSMLVPSDARAIVTAYDASGRLLGVADRIDGAAGGERLSLTGLGDIARIHISGHGPIAYDDLRIAEPMTPSRLPEPATWAMLIAGFAIIAAVVRRCIRVSERRFTEQVRRIAAGENG